MPVTVNGPAIGQPGAVSGAGNLEVTPSGDTSGATDMVNLAAAYARVSDTGECVILGPGDWYLDGLLTIPSPAYSATTWGATGVVTRGYGAGVTRIHQLADNTPCFVAPISSVMMVNFSDMSLLGPQTWGDDSVGLWYGYSAANGSHHLCSNLEISGFAVGVRFWQCAFFTFDNCFVHDNARGYEFGNNVDGVQIRGGRISNHVARGSKSGAGVYFGWKNATHSPGVVTENNRVQIDGGIKFGENDVSLDFADYASGPILVSAYFEHETKIAWLGDGVTTNRFTQGIEFVHCMFNRLDLHTTPMIECRSPSSAGGSITIRQCHTDASDIPNGFLAVGPGVAVTWDNNQLPSATFQIRQDPAGPAVVTTLDRADYYRYSNANIFESDASYGSIASTCTISVGTPCTVTISGGHKCVPGSAVKFSVSGGTLPTGIASGTYYKVVKDSSYSSTAFRIANTSTGALVATSDAGSGTFTCTRNRISMDVRMHNGSNQAFQTWRRVSTTNAVVGTLDCAVVDVDGKWVLYRGMVQLGYPVSTLPTASAAYRGVIAYQEGGTGVADTIVACMKNSADAYTWTVVATGT